MDREGVDFAKALSGPSPAEKWDAADDVEAKTRQLAELFREAKGRIVVFTGAGISTSSGIPARVRRDSRPMRRNPTPLFLVGLPVSDGYELGVGPRLLGQESVQQGVALLRKADDLPIRVSDNQSLPTQYSDFQ